MGNQTTTPKPQQQHSSPTNPLILRLRRTLKLHLNKTSNQKTTYSFLHTNFSTQITKNNPIKLNSNYSPFCWIILQDHKQQQQIIITCTLISPIMAIVPNFRLCNSEGFLLSEKIDINGVFDGKEVKKKIKKVVVLKEGFIALLILEKPFWELGWCGLTYVQESNQISSLPIFSIYNVFQQSEKDEKSGQKKEIISQKIDKIYCKQNGKLQGKSVKTGQNFLLKIIQRKPYIIGVQREDSCIFFGIDLIKSLQVKVEEYLSPSMEKNILKEIDLQQMEIKSDW